MLAYPPLISYGVGATVRYTGPSTLVLSLDGAGGLVALVSGMVGTVTAANDGRVVVQFRNAYRTAVRAGSVHFERVWPLDE
jgi:hypothetical protein